MLKPELLVEKITITKEAEISTTKTCRDTCCVVRYLHLATTLLSGYYTQRNKSQVSRYLRSFKIKIFVHILVWKVRFVPNNATCNSKCF